MHSAQRFTAPSASLPVLHSAQHCTPRPRLSGGSRAQREAGVRGRQPPTTEPSPSQEKPSAAASGGTAQRSTKALPVQQRLETLHKVYALAFPFSAAHIQRAPLHSAQRYAVLHSATQCAAMHSAQRCIAHAIAQRPALHCAQRFTASVAQCVYALHRAEVSEV